MIPISLLEYHTFPYCSRMWCCAKLSLTTIKLLLYFNTFFFLGTSIVSEAVCAIFLPRVTPLYKTTAWYICESKEKPFNIRIYLWFTKVMFYWNSLQKTMSGSFNITENKTQEYTNDDQKWKKQVSMYAKTLLRKSIIIHSAI